NQGVDIFAAHAFEVPTTLPPGSLHDLLTVFLDPSVGKGGILHVVNDAGDRRRSRTRTCRSQWSTTPELTMRASV
ncbi:MAG TPA: hypothetical protein VFK62_11195, partial [Gaiellaceae bacterium]|nr:hypothetical protein [Gaiellaceae bacterium]